MLDISCIGTRDFLKAFTNLLYLHIHVPIVVSMNIQTPFLLYVHKQQPVFHMVKKGGKYVSHIILLLVP